MGGKAAERRLHFAKWRKNSALLPKKRVVTAWLSEARALRPRHMRRLAFAVAARCSRRAVSSAAEVSTSFAARGAPSDTIFALSTAPGRAGIAVIRVSGPATREVLRLLPPGGTRRGGGETGSHTSHASLRIRHREVLPTRFVCPTTGQTLDRGLFLWFDRPNSFTGEDLCELHVHGSLAVVKAVLLALGTLSPPGGEHKSGGVGVETGVVRHAEPGEFTLQAFRNNKLDLTEAEGLGDLLRAETEAQRRQALAIAGGSLRTLYSGWRTTLRKAHAHCEASLDFGEDDEIGNDVFLSLAPIVNSLLSELRLHLAAPPIGEMTRSGVRVALIGPPNAGKSSLLNALAGRPVAIVSDVPGTTRDAVEVGLDLNGHKVLVTDTAGARETNDAVELEGIKRSKQHARDADVVVLVVDGASMSGVETLPKWAMDTAHAVVLNKADLLEGGVEKNDWRGILNPLNPNLLAATTLSLSCATGNGIDAFVEWLRVTVAARVDGTAGDGAGICAITRSRHRGRLEECVVHLARFESAAACASGRHEVAAEELRLAQRALGHVTGHVDVEELLDVIFRDFCIGK